MIGNIFENEAAKEVALKALEELNENAEGIPMTEEMLDMMTDDIYDRVEADGRINVDISVEVRNNEEVQENRQRRPRRRNRFLRDLIRILLLRELLRRRPRFPIRPF